MGNLYDLAPAARAVIWLPMQIPNTGSGRSLSRTCPGGKLYKKHYHSLLCKQAHLKSVSLYFQEKVVQVFIVTQDQVGPCWRYWWARWPEPDHPAHWRWTSRHILDSSSPDPKVPSAPLLPSANRDTLCMISSVAKERWKKWQRISCIRGNNLSFTLYRENIWIHFLLSSSGLTLASRRMMLCLIPQSTATTFIGFPFPKIFISYKRNITRVFTDTCGQRKDRTDIWDVTPCTSEASLSINPPQLPRWYSWPRHLSSAGQLKKKKGAPFKWQTNSSGMKTPVITSTV